MFYLCFSIIIVCIYIICDVNYVLRTCFTILSGRLYQKRYKLSDVTTIYDALIIGAQYLTEHYNAFLRIKRLCTFQDCDIGFKYIRMARLVREIDFARYHFYDRTGIYHRSYQLSIKSLQGSTLTISAEAVPLFVPYKINTKLVYWDERSLFLEHEVVTLHDNKLRCLLVSRQYAIGVSKETVDSLLKGLPGANSVRKCPEYIENWLQSMHKSSLKLRNSID